MLYCVKTMSIFLPKNLLSDSSRELFLAKFSKFPTLKLVKTPTSKAAVFVPICTVKETISILYTVRSIHLKSHSGQISFPGGKTDEGENAVQTALRETEEELGLLRSNVNVWGHGPALPGRNNKVLITPVVGTVTNYNQDELRPNFQEVTEVFNVPIQALCDPKKQFYTQFQNGFILPVFVYEKYKIWGVTAYITHAVLNCLLPKEIYRNDWMKKKITSDEFTLPKL